MFLCLCRTTYEHRHTALGKAQGKTGRHRQDAWASPMKTGCRFLGGPALTLSFALEMSCVNSWNERKAAETCSSASLKIACRLVRSGAIHVGFCHRYSLATSPQKDTHVNTAQTAPCFRAFCERLMNTGTQLLAKRREKPGGTGRMPGSAQ
jgi:hypothetical protein